MVIATRTLTVVSPASETPVAISVHAPELSDGLWLCRYAIGWPGRIRSDFAAGADSVQALHHALQKVGMELYLSPYHASGSLKWEKAGEGYGFPVPRNGRDMLVGYDKTFDG